MVAVPAASLVFAFFASGLVLLATGHNALSSYRRLFDAAFLNHGALGDTLVSATPLAFTGLAAAAAFRMRLFNIGGGGRPYIGAIPPAPAGPDLRRNGGPRPLARRPRLARRRGPGGAGQAQAVRFRGDRARRLPGGGPVRGNADAPEDHRGDVDLRGDRRPGRREPGRRLPAPARRRPERPPAPVL